MPAEAVAREQSVAIHWQNLGACLSGRGKWTEAAAAYREAVARDANNATAWASLAAAQQWLGNLAAAEECFQKSFVLRPARRGNAHPVCLPAPRPRTKSNRLSTSPLPAFSKEAHRTAEAWNALANAHLLLDRLPEAEAALVSALSCRPVIAWLNVITHNCSCGFQRKNSKRSGASGQATRRGRCVGRGLGLARSGVLCGRTNRRGGRRTSAVHGA